MSLLNYLMSFVDYDYYDYEQEGIAKLIKLLKEKYPHFGTARLCKINSRRGDEVGIKIN